jgi:hypothetical protein
VDAQSIPLNRFRAPNAPTETENWPKDAPRFRLVVAAAGADNNSMQIDEQSGAHEIFFSVSFFLSFSAPG